MRLVRAFFENEVQRRLAARLGETWPLLLVFIGIGSALRLHMLGVKSLWLDEAFSVSVARMSLPMFLRTAWWGEANMILYYFFLRMWLHLGDSEFQLRSLSVLIGVLTIAATYVLGERFLGRKVGLIASALLTVHSFHIRYSQELRSYTLVTLLVVLSTYAFLAVLEAPDRKVFWVLYALLSTLAIYAQVLVAFVLFGQWLVLTPGRIKRLGIFNLLTLGTAIGALAAPVAAVMLLQNKGQLDWVPRPTPARIFDVLQYMAGAEPLSSHGSARNVFLLICYATTWIIAFTVLGRVQPSQMEQGRTRPAQQVLVLGFVSPIVAMIGISFLKPIMFPRYLLMCVPAAVLLAAQGLITLEQRLPRGRIVSSVVLLTIITMACFSVRDYYVTFGTYGHDWREVTSFLLSQRQPEDAAIFYTFSGHRVFDYYVGRDRKAGSQGATPDVLFPLELDPTSIAKRTMPYPRVWLILHQTIPSTETNRQSAIIRSALQKHFHLAGERAFPGTGATRDETGGILIALYSAACTK